MTVSSTTVKNSYSGNGSTTQFAYGYKIFADSDLIVIIRVNSTGTETVKTLTTHYTVAGAGDASGGSITFTSGNTPASGETVVIIREVPQTQAIDYIANDPFPAESHEEGLDRGTMTTQQVQEEVDRSLKLSRTNTMTSTEFTVGATDRANKVLSFDSSGELSVTQELGTFRGNWGASTAYQVRDIVKDTSTNNIFMANTAHTSSGSQPLTSNTDSAKWDLIVDAASSTTSQNAAAASATASANSATASANSATASANSATASANSATASANSATASGNSATAAATSETNAAASFDSFDDRYLGAKSSAPSTDNDGNALLTGALYFNSSSNQIFSWTGSAWQAIKPTSSEQTNIDALSASAVIADMAILGTTDVVNDMNILATTDVVSDMNTLATSDVVADMNTLGTSDVVNDMNVLGSSATVAAMNVLGTSAVVADLAILGTTDVVNDMNVLGTSANVTAMNLLGTSAVVTDMGILGTADVVSDMNTLGTADVVNDMNVLGTSANVTAMNTLGTSTNVTNMATVSANIAGVNSFADRYRVASSDPSSSLDEGDLVYNTTGNVLKYYNGSAWVNVVSGSLAHVVQDGTPQLGGDLDLNSNDITGTGNINITGTGTLTENLTVNKTTGAELILSRNDTSIAVDDLIGGIQFKANDASSSPDPQICGIKAISTGATNTNAKLNFFAGESNYNSNTPDMSIDANGNMTVKGNLAVDTDTLYVDSSNNRVGINTNTPGFDLVVKDASGAATIRAENGADNKIVDLIADSTGGLIRTIGSYPLVFNTNQTERGRFDASGNLFVAKTSAAYQTVGHELLASGRAFHTASGGKALSLVRLSSDGAIVDFYKDGTEIGNIGAKGGYPYFAHSSGSGIKIVNNEIRPSDNTGGTSDNAVDLGTSSRRFKDIYLGGGAFLGGTGTANKLEDYEEGTFTPLFASSGGGTASGYGTQTGRYTKIGRLVYIALRVTLSNKSGLNSGGVNVGGLPFNSNSGNAGRLGVLSGDINNISSFGLGDMGGSYLGPNSTAISLMDNSQTAVQVSDLANNSTVDLQMTYEAS